MKKTAIILFNLGGPDSTKAIRPFLFNFFTDKNIIRLPYPLRWLVANMIATRRSKKEAAVSYGELGGKSPLLENSREQAEALEQLLNHSGDIQYKVFVCMRYWHPMAPEIAKQVREWDADDVVLLPLYPQYSTTTTRSSYQAWNAACKKLGLKKPTKLVCCYPAENGFVQACAANIREVYKKAEFETGVYPRVLLSAHGLPEKIVKDGDPYQMQCELSARAIVAATGLDDPDWQICYQSRVGPQTWLGPSTEDALKKAAADAVPVIILPHAFTQEHVETLVEIEVEYREIAAHLGVPGFYRVPTVGVHPDFIQGLADMVVTSRGNAAVASYVGTRLCPSGFSCCAMRELKACSGCASC